MGFRRFSAAAENPFMGLAYLVIHSCSGNERQNAYQKSDELYMIEPVKQGFYKYFKQINWYLDIKKKWK